MLEDMFAESFASNLVDNLADSFVDLLVYKPCWQDSWPVSRRLADSLRATLREDAQIRWAVGMSLFVQMWPVGWCSQDKLWMQGKPLTQCKPRTQGKPRAERCRFDWSADWRCEAEEYRKFAAEDYSLVDKSQQGSWLLDRKLMRRAERKGSSAKQ